MQDAVVAQPVTLEAALYSDAGGDVYAVLDGASIPSLLERLEHEAPEYACLYRLEAESDLATVAPYLVLLERGTRFTNWVLQHCAGQHWGIFFVSDADLETHRRRLRKITLVDDHRHRTLLFRFYDPRVLNEYMCMFDRGQLADIFEVVSAYFAEIGETGAQWSKFTLGANGLEHHLLNIHAG